MFSAYTAYSRHLQNDSLLLDGYKLLSDRKLKERKKRESENDNFEINKQ